MRKTVTLLLAALLLLAAQTAFATDAFDELPALGVDHIGHINYAEYFPAEGAVSPLTPEEEDSIIAVQVMDTNYASMPMWLKLPEGEKREDYMGKGAYFRVEEGDYGEDTYYYVPSRLEIISPIAYGTIDAIHSEDDITTIHMTPFYGAEPDKDGIVAFLLTDETIVHNVVTAGLTYEVIYDVDTMEVVEIHRANG